MVLIDYMMNTVNRIQNTADRTVMVEGVDHQCNIFAHVTINIIRSFQKFRRLIDQIGSQNGIDAAFLIRFIKLFKAVGEQAEGCGGKEEIMSSRMITSLPSTEDPRNSWATIGLRPSTIFV